MAVGLEVDEQHRVLGLTGGLPQHTMDRIEGRSDLEVRWRLGMLARSERCARHCSVFD